MTFDQTASAAVLACTLALFIWGRWRFDLVAVTALSACVLIGIVPYDDVFLGFSHPAVITVAIVLILSRAIANSGVVEELAGRIAPADGPVWVQMSAFCGLGAVLSAFMNNVGALALLMPAVIAMAARANRSPSLFLMPLAFASMLGGLITLIGTPANIIVATYRGRLEGYAPFSMFSFAPVGIAVAVVGIAYIVLVGWRLIPVRAKAGREELFAIDDYIAEARVDGDSISIGKSLADVEVALGDIDAKIIGLVRGERRITPAARSRRLRENDILIVEAAPDALQAAVEALGVKIVNEAGSAELVKDDEDGRVIEAIVQPRTVAENLTVEGLRLNRRYGINILAVSRQGRPYRGRLKAFRLAAGDVVLLQGADDRIAAALSALGFLPLAQRSLSIGRMRRPWETLAIALGGLAAAAFGLLPVAVALMLAATLLLLLGILPLREAYDAVDWPIIVLLASMIPVGGTIESTGLAQLIAAMLVDLVGGLAPFWVLAALLVVTMTLSDVVNNAATAVVMAPIAVTLANTLGASPDPFLMAVAIGASCAFLTPIGHQNNTLVMGPGGYRFGDYWRMGLPLEVLVVAVSAPAILHFWPL